MGKQKKLVQIARKKRLKEEKERKAFEEKIKRIGEGTVFEKPSEPEQV